MGDDTEQISEAMRMCAADLGELDCGWLEILGFAAVPSWPAPRGLSFTPKSRFSLIAISPMRADIRRFYG